jgi:hypothetical protein
MLLKVKEVWQYFICKIVAMDKQGFNAVQHVYFDNIAVTSRRAI